MSKGKKLELSVEGFITDTKKFLEEMRALKDENETLRAHNNDLLHEIRILKNKIETFKNIYTEGLQELAKTNEDGLSIKPEVSE